ncbi:MAG: potassium channel protein, partial [Methanobacteriota archaeon]
IVGAGSELAERTLGEVKLQSRTGMRVIGIRRGNAWIYDPDKWSAVKAGDILLAKGPLAGVMPLHAAAGAKALPVADAIPASLVDDLDRAARMIVELKNLSELAVNLAYTSLLLSSKEVAHEVRLLDDRMRAMRADLDLWVLQAARKVDNVGDLRGLLMMSASSEDIGEAASAIADVILRDIEIPPLFAKIIRESDEIISRVTVRDDSSLAGRSLAEASLGTVTGMVVIAIKSGDRWTYRPKKTVVIRAGDVIIAKGRRDGECRLMHLSGSMSEMGAECGE